MWLNTSRTASGMMPGSSHSWSRLAPPPPPPLPPPPRIVCVLPDEV